RDEHTNLDEGYSGEEEEGDNDVRPSTAAELAIHLPQDDKGLLTRLRGTNATQARLKLARPLPERPCPEGPNDEEPIVREDDVCIHVVGLPKELTASVAFSEYDAERGLDKVTD